MGKTDRSHTAHNERKNEKRAALVAERKRAKDAERQAQHEQAVAEYKLRQLEDQYGKKF